MGKEYTICNLYLPHVPVTKQEISSLIDQLDSPFLLMGDMNAKRPLWAGGETNNKGAIFEQLLLERDIHICIK